MFLGVFDVFWDVLGCFDGVFGVFSECFKGVKVCFSGCSGSCCNAGCSGLRGSFGGISVVMVVEAERAVMFMRKSYG